MDEESYQGESVEILPELSTCFISSYFFKEVSIDATKETTKADHQLGVASECATDLIWC